MTHPTPKTGKRKKQPTAQVMREQLALAADEIIALRTRLDAYEMHGSLQVLAESMHEMPWSVIIDGKPVVSPELVITQDGRLQVRGTPRHIPWYRRLWNRIRARVVEVDRG